MVNKRKILAWSLLLFYLIAINILASIDFSMAQPQQQEIHSIPNGSLDFVPINVGTSFGFQASAVKNRLYFLGDYRAKIYQEDDKFDLVVLSYIPIPLSKGKFSYLPIHIIFAVCFFIVLKGGKINYAKKVHSNSTDFSAGAGNISGLHDVQSFGSRSSDLWLNSKG